MHNTIIPEHSIDVGQLYGGIKDARIYSANGLNQILILSKQNRKLRHKNGVSSKF